MFSDWKSEYRKTSEYIIFLVGLIIGIVGISGLLFLRLSPWQISDFLPKCSFHEVTGLYCPGCGGTRALFAFVRGHWLRSLWMHPVVPYAGILYFIFMIRGFFCIFSQRKYPMMRFYLGYVYVGIGIIFMQFIGKNLLLLVWHLDWLAY